MKDMHSESFPRQGGLGGRLTEFPIQQIGWVKCPLDSFLDAL